MAMSQGCLIMNYMSDFTRHWFSFWKVDASSVCGDEDDISGKIVVVTGSNTGIGKAIALQMAKRKAIVVMAVRDLGKGQAALDDIKETLLKTQDSVTIELMKLDLGDLQSIRDFVQEFQKKYDHLDILVNNAGFMDTRGTLTKTKDGFEQHIGVNHLGPFLLTRLLHDSLKKGAPSRVVCVASSNAGIATLDLDDLMMEKKVKTGDSGKEPYNISKLCNAICVRKWASELDEAEGVKVFQMCPGLVNTDVFRNEEGFLKKMTKAVALSTVGLTPHQGAETAVFCAVAKSVATPEHAGHGDFYRFKKIWVKGEQMLSDYLKDEQSETLYRLTEELVGLRPKSKTISGSS